MRRWISLACALALLIGGLYWLGVIIIDMSGWLTDGYEGPTTTVRTVKMIIMVPIMMVVMGAFWLVEDYIGPLGPRLRRRFAPFSSPRANASASFKPSAIWSNAFLLMIIPPPSHPRISSLKMGMLSARCPSGHFPRLTSS
jgi:hypothetical protein